MYTYTHRDTYMCMYKFKMQDFEKSNSIGNPFLEKKEKEKCQSQCKLNVKGHNTKVIKQYTYNSMAITLKTQKKSTLFKKHKNQPKKTPKKQTFITIGDIQSRYRTVTLEDLGC